MPLPVPRDRGKAALVRYGLAQPFLGLRTIFRSSDLLGISLAPSVGLALIAVIVGVHAASEHGMWRGLLASWLAIAALAPLPPLIFGRIYAHLAAKARPHLGLAPAAPYLRGLVQLAGEWLAQVVVLAIGVLPLTLLAKVLPGVGIAVAVAVQGAWALHWIVVEGYDNCRTLPEGRTVQELEDESHKRPGSPWFHRWHHTVTGPKWLLVILGPVRMLSEVVTSLARAWRVEVDLAEDEPWISLGFGLGVVVMLAVPGLNLLFRPAVVVGGVHLRYRLLEEGGARPGVGGTQPYPVVPISSRLPS